MDNNKFISIGAMLLLLLLSPLSYAHQLSTAHLDLVQNSAGQHSGRLSVSFADLEKFIGIDNNFDGKVTWEETNAARQKIISYIESNTKVQIIVAQGAAKLCSISFNQAFSLTQKYTETLLSIPLNLVCPASHTKASAIQLDYYAFIDTLNHHKLLLSWEATNQQQALLDKNSHSFKLKLNNDSALSTAKFYFWQGILHIWLGFDHLIFVLLLMLPLAKTLFTLKPMVDSPRALLPLLIPSLKLITGFTVAHSITLCISAFGWSSLPINWVEAGIAFSVVLTALNVVFNWVKNIFWITFVFGLLHGLGFASALGNLGINQEQQLISILLFNLGVETGQILFILALMPVFIVARKVSILRNYAVNACATLTLGIGLFWFFERVGVV
ncbi:HupE/UreJ family protein [Aliikangiella sp. IMCC44632]